MASKKITIFLVPDGTNKIKKIRISKFFFSAFIILFIFSAAAAAWLIHDRESMKIQVARLHQLERENEIHRRQTLHLAERINRITKKVGELNQFDHKLRVMVNLDTEEDSSEFKGVGGSSPIFLDSGDGMTKSHEKLVREMHLSLDDLDQEVALDEKDKNELYRFLKGQKVLLACTPSIWPTKGWMSSRFGYRISPFTGEKEFHRGVDIATRLGAPITAPADGVVESVAWDHGYGRILTIRHGYGLVTKYAHLKKALVEKGQYVKRGETIALVGNSGRSTGSHLHYEVHLDRVAVNPLHYILN